LPIRASPAVVAATGKVAAYQWIFTDGKPSRGSTAERVYRQPGFCSAVLHVTDATGASITILQWWPRTAQANSRRRFTRSTSRRLASSQPGDPVMFLMRTFRTTDGREAWDFGGGSPWVEAQCDGNMAPVAKGSHARTVHRYQKPGQYVVRVERTNRRGHTAVGHVHICVGVE
jgi:hypothetical protein